MSLPPDIIISNARVYTADPVRPWAESFAVREGILVAIGDVSEIATLAGTDTVIRDLGGAFVMPGLIDVHNHHALAGRADLFELTFSSELSFEQVLDAVRRRADTLAEGAWILGGSWGSTLLPELMSERARHALDAAAGGRPVMLSDDSHHNRLVSTAALELAGITADSADPDGGVIVRDPHTGRPSGVLLEAAGLPVEEALARTQRLTAAEHAASSARAVEILHSYGVTAFQDAGASVDILRSLKQLDDAGELTAWVVTSMLINDPILGLSPVGAELIDQGEQYRSRHHRPDFVKIFLDGVPPTRTGAFLEPYLPDDVHGAHFTGTTTMDPAELVGWLRRSAAAGLGAKVHCTGDAAVRVVLDAVEIVRREGYTHTAIQVAHGQFVHPDDVPRFAALNVYADISPFIWVPGVIPDAIAAVLPAELAAHMQPNRDLLDAGALVAGGSDWPVSASPDALEGIQGLVTRADPSGTFAGTLWAEQAISVAEAVAVFTIDAARAMGVDDVTGSLVPGKSADFVVLSQNLFEVDPDRIAASTVEQTWFAGEPVFKRD
ncbi:amidohydrolase [Subtercola sp. YIM 133946]|uniref:amidohydrolase n=1 Tax=Subtercola sp. YIM 133946 TaxID=3118909 RepID=UPI002F94FE35